MRSKMASALLTFMGLALLIYTASRTLNFLRLTLPANSQDTAYLALVAFDGGLVLWTMFYLHGATGAWQRGISALMIVVDLVGVLIGFGADTMYQATATGLARMTASDAQTAVLGMVVIIGLNVAAVVITHMVHPDALRAAAEEEAKDKIKAATVAAISGNADHLAAELAPYLAGRWSSDMRAQHMNEPKPPAELPPAPSAHKAQSGLRHFTDDLLSKASNGNGTEHPNA